MTRTRGQRGQSTVEFALVVPLLLLVAMALVQVALVAWGQIAVTAAAREAARVLAVDPSADAEAIVEAITLGNSRSVHVSVDEWEEVSSERQFIVVRVTFDVPLLFDVFSGFDATIPISARSIMLSEG